MTSLTCMNAMRGVTTLKTLDRVVTGQETSTLSQRKGRAHPKHSSRCHQAGGGGVSHPGRGSGPPQRHVHDSIWPIRLTVALNLKTWYLEVKCQFCLHKTVNHARMRKYVRVHSKWVVCIYMLVWQKIPHGFWKRTWCCLVLENSSNVTSAMLFVWQTLPYG